MEQAGLNRVVRSLLHVGQTPRALRMLSIMTNKGLKPYRSTIDALVAGCAKDSNSQAASEFYWYASQQSLLAFVTLQLLWT